VPLSRDDLDHIRHAYEAGLHRGKELAGAGQLEGATGYSVAHVDRYSPEQTAWARSRFGEEQAWRRGKRVNVTHMIRRLREGQGSLALAGADFERYFPGGPELGEATSVGNIFVAAGLTNLISLWMGLSATAVNALSQTGHTPVVGVGTGTAAAGTGDAALIGNNNAAGAYYQAFDATSLGTTTVNGQVVGTSTFASGVANFQWQEWCWATGAGSVTPGSSMSGTANAPFSTANSAAMVNHKTLVNLGTKASGSSWVFSTTFTIS